MVNIHIYHHSLLNQLKESRLFYSIGFNSNRNPHSNTNIGTHAEIDALIKIRRLILNKKIKNTKSIDLIVIRINSSKNLCLSEPCYHCTMELLKNKSFKIRNLYYSNEKDTLNCIKFKDWIISKKYKVSSGYLNYSNCID